MATMSLGTIRADASERLVCQAPARCPAQHAMGRVLSGTGLSIMSSIVVLITPETRPQRDPSVSDPPHSFTTVWGTGSPSVVSPTTLRPAVGGPGWPGSLV